MNPYFSLLTSIPFILEPTGNRTEPTVLYPPRNQNLDDLTVICSRSYSKNSCVMQAFTASRTDLDFILILTFQNQEPTSGLQIWHF